MYISKIKEEEYKTHPTVDKLLHKVEYILLENYSSYPYIKKEMDKSADEVISFERKIKVGIYVNLLGIYTGVSNVDLVFNLPYFKHIIIPDRLNGIWTDELFPDHKIKAILKRLMTKSLICTYCSEEWNKVFKKDYRIWEYMYDEVLKSININYEYTDKNYDKDDATIALTRFFEDIDSELEKRSGDH